MNSNFTVPTLSLSGSRARKQYSTSIPTRDYSQIPPKAEAYYQRDISREHKYTQNEQYQTQTNQEKLRKTSIFPPKPSISYKQAESRDINKNVYLNSPEHQASIHSNVNFSYRAEQSLSFEPQQNITNPPTMTHSTSSKGLLTNPYSSRIVQEQVNLRTASRKIDVGKMMFDRKLTKLLSEASFYEQQLLGVGNDELGSHLQELIELKQSHLSEHRSLIEGLSALIN